MSGGAHTFCGECRTQKQEERLFFLPGKDSDNEKSQTFFFYYSRPNFLFPSIKESSFPCHSGSSMCLAIVADPILQFSADPK